jgi:peptide-methionine (R)-S-oxide reductase
MDVDDAEKKRETNEYWRSRLTPEQYHVLRERGTEQAFTGELYKNGESGMYMCIACGAPLFSSETKFESNSGWPSFSDVAQSENVELKKDTSHGLERVEVTCANCGGHLGHLFEDGPEPSKKRYCINSCALDFKKGTVA